MVLGAGFGTRLQPLTHTLAKPACPVLGRPLIEFTLSQLAPLNPRTVVVNLHHLPDTLRACLDPAPFGLPIQTLFEPEILGTGGGLKNARDRLADADVVLLLNGDTICDADLAALLAAHRKSDALATLLLLDDPRTAKYGAVEVDDGSAIVDFAELRGQRGVRRGLFVGAHALSPRLFDFLPNDDVFCIVRHAYVPLLESRPGAVRAHFAGARFFDLGTPYDYLLGQWALLDDPGGFTFALNGVRESSAQVWSEKPPRVTRPPVWIAPDALVDDEAVLGPYVIVGHGAHVGPAARLHHCIVWPGASVDRELDQAIITPAGEHAVGY